MTEPDRPLTDAYAAVEAEGFKASDAAVDAHASARAARVALAAANAAAVLVDIAARHAETAARHAEDAGGLAQEVSQALGDVLDTLDAEGGTTT